MDDADRAEMRTSEDLAARIAAIRSQPAALPTGACLNCEEDCAGSFCDTDCRDDYERRVRMAKINGARP